jgi:hypothetical protein
MRALFASVLMALALLWASTTGGRAPPSLRHFPTQTLSAEQSSDHTATFTPSGQHARLLLTTGRQARRGPGFQPLPLLLPVPPRLELPLAELTQCFALRCAPARGARLLPYGPRAPPAYSAPVLFT